MAKMYAPDSDLVADQATSCVKACEAQEVKTDVRILPRSVFNTPFLHNFFL